MMHPTPWKSQKITGSASRIVDADGRLVETVYGREGDSSGIELANRIVEAVNLTDEVEVGPDPGAISRVIQSERGR